jgi:hypothetical protein
MKCVKCDKRLPARQKQANFILERLEVCPACYRKYPEFQRCKEDGCNGLVPTKGKDVITFACQMLRMCRYCYEAKFPEPGPNTLPPCRQGSKRLLTPYDRQRMTRKQFEYREMVLWDSAFLYEWLEYIHWNDEL